MARGRLRSGLLFQSGVLIAPSGSGTAFYQDSLSDLDMGTAGLHL